MVDKIQKILVVDDEEKFLNSIAQRLKLLGFDPLKASSGRQALALAREAPIDLAIVDLRMPDMDGLVTITKLKEIAPDLKSVLLTGYGGEKVKEATKALDAAYFEKEDMGRFWGFVRKVLQGLETSMAAAGMATGGDLEDAVDIESHHGKKK